MGAWGAKLFQDDEAADIKDEFDSRILNGEHPLSVMESILGANAPYLDDMDIGPIVLLSLAYLIHKEGVMQSAVIDRALSVIRNSEGLERWREQSERSLQSRLRLYKELEQFLVAPPPTKSRVKRTRFPRLWDIIEISLSDGRYAYMHYVAIYPNAGSFFQIFKLVTEHPGMAEQAMESGTLFTHAIFGQNPPVRDGRWKIIKNAPLVKYKLPLFKYPEDGSGQWSIFDNGEYVLKNGRLPQKYEALEDIAAYNPYWLDERIIHDVRRY